MKIFTSMFVFCVIVLSMFSGNVFATDIGDPNDPNTFTAGTIEMVMRKYQSRYNYVKMAQSGNSQYLTWPSFHCSGAPSYPIDFYKNITEEQAEDLVDNIIGKFYTHNVIYTSFIEKLPQGEPDYITLNLSEPSSTESWQERLAHVNYDLDQLKYYRVGPADFAANTDVYHAGSGEDSDIWEGTQCDDFHLSHNASFSEAVSGFQNYWQSTYGNCGGIGVQTSSQHSYHKFYYHCGETEHWYTYDSYYAGAATGTTKLYCDLTKHTGSAHCYLKLVNYYHNYQSCGSFDGIDGPASFCPVPLETDPNEPPKYHQWTSPTTGQEWTSSYLFDPNGVPSIPTPSRRVSEDPNGDYYTDVSEEGWFLSQTLIVVEPDFVSESDPVLSCNSPTELVYKTKDKHVVYSANEGCGHSTGETVKGRILVNGYVPDAEMRVEITLNKEFSDKFAQLKIDETVIDSDDLDSIYCFWLHQGEPNEPWYVPFSVSAKINEDHISFSAVSVYTQISDPNNPRVKAYRSDPQSFTFQIKNNGYECCNRKETLNKGDKYPWLNKHENGDVEIFLPDIEQTYIMTPSFLDMFISAYVPEGAGPDEYIKLSGDGGNSLVYHIDSNWNAENTASAAAFIFELDTDDMILKSAEYDGHDRLDKICNAADPTNFYRKFNYDDPACPNRVTSYTDIGGNVSRNYTLVYDETSGRLAGSIGGTGSGCSSCALSGSHQLYYYDDFGNLQSLTDIEGTVIHEYEYDTENRLTNTWLGPKVNAVPVQEVVYSSADANDFGGVEIQDVYDYTESGDYRLTRKVMDSNSMVIASIAFDTLNINPSTLTSPNAAIARGGYMTTYGHNYSGTTLISMTTKSPRFYAGLSDWYTKNTLNNSSYNNEQTILVNADPNVAEIVLSSSVYSDGRLTADYDAGGYLDSNPTSYSYDIYGRLIIQAGPNVTQLNGKTTNPHTRYTYYPDGRIKTEIVSNSSVTTHTVTTYLYNYLGHPTGTETRDADGSLLFSTRTRSNGFGEDIYSVDASGVAQGKEYDSGGKIVSEFVFADSNDTALFDGNDPNILTDDLSSVYTNLEVTRQTRYVYNDLGQLYQVKVAVSDDIFTYDNPDSWHITSYLYDDYGRKYQQTEYTAQGTLTTTYEYNQQGQVTKTNYPDGHWTRLLRNGRGLVTKTTEGYGPENTSPNDFVITETVYDADGNVVKEIRGGGVTQSYILDDMGSVWRAYQGDYQAGYCDYTEYLRDLDGRVIDQNSVDVDMFGNETIIQEVHNRYNVRGELIEQRILNNPGTGEDDLLDKIILYNYDTQGRQIETITKGDGNSQIYTNGYENRVNYEAGDKIEQHWYDLSGKPEYTLNFEYVGEMAAYYDLPFNSIENAFAYTKDHQDVYIAANSYTHGQLAHKTILKGFDEDDPYFDYWNHPLAGLPWHPAATYEYNSAGHIVKAIDADSNFTVFAYNSQNQQTARTLWQGKPVLRVSDVGYDPNTFEPYPLQRVLTAYDAAGRRVQTAVLADPNASAVNPACDKITNFVYGADGNLYRKKELIEQSGVSSVYALTEYSYDDHDRVIQILYGSLEEIDVFGAILETKGILKTVGYQYNTKGQKTVQTTTEVNTGDATTKTFTTYYDYDAQGRLDEIRNAQGVVYACEYDALGRKAKETNAVGMVTRYDYYTTGQLYKKTEDPTGLNRQTVYTYDRFGRQTSIGSGSDQTDYAYNYLDQVTDVNYPSGDTLDFGYDMLGSVVSRTDTKDSVSITTHYKRDALGRVCYKQYTGQTDWTEPNSLLPFDEILYDAAGRKSIIAYMGADGNDLELNMYSYNSFGNLTNASENGSNFSSSVIYGYDQRGLLKSITYPNENAVIYTRDALGRMDSVRYNGKLLAEYDYLGETVIGKKMPEAYSEYVAAVDTLGRISGETFSTISTGTPFMANSYDYTGHSSRMDERNGIDYGFDTLGKLTDEGGTAYTSDLLGNPTNAPDDGLIYLLDNESRIVDINDVSGDVAKYTYDRLGRRASKTVGQTKTNFVYDLNGNIIAEYENGNWKRDYIYGAQNEVVYMRSPQTVEMNDAMENFFSFIDAWLCYPNCTTQQLVWDYDDSNDINLLDWAAAVDANDFAGAFATNGRYILTDFRNSVVGVVGLDGSVTEISYNAWGTPSYSGNLEGLSVLWNGYYLDDETGNYYLRNRYYSPMECRFLTEDPHGVNPDENWNNPLNILGQHFDGYGLAVYAQSDPINNIDSYGLFIGDRFSRTSSCDCKKECGPDVTKAFSKLLSATRKVLEEEFKKPGRKEEICSTGSFFDLRGIYTGHGWEAFFGNYNPTKDACNNTVTYKGHCVNPWELNYLYWGYLNRKCKMSSNKFQFWTDHYTSIIGPFKHEDPACKRSFACMGYFGYPYDKSCTLDKCCEPQSSNIWTNVLTGIAGDLRIQGN